MKNICNHNNEFLDSILNGMPFYHIVDSKFREALRRRARERAEERMKESFWKRYL